MWAVEGANGVGRPLAQRLLEAGEDVVDVPAKLAARARLLDTGHGRKSDAHDAHSVAVAAVRAKDLRVLAVDPQLQVLRMLVDLCVPNALSQPGGYTLGSQAGEAAIRRVVHQAGFTRFRRAAETPFNHVYEARL